MLEYELRRPSFNILKDPCNEKHIRICHKMRRDINFLDFSIFSSDHWPLNIKVDHLIPYSSSYMPAININTVIKPQ